MKISKLLTLIFCSMSAVMLSYEMKNLVVYIFLNVVFFFIIINTFFDLLSE